MFFLEEIKSPVGYVDDDAIIDDPGHDLPGVQFENGPFDKGLFFIEAIIFCDILPEYAIFGAKAVEVVAFSDGMSHIAADDHVDGQRLTAQGKGKNKKQTKRPFSLMFS